MAKWLSSGIVFTGLWVQIWAVKFGSQVHFFYSSCPEWSCQKGICCSVETEQVHLGKPGEQWSQSSKSAVMLKMTTHSMYCLNIICIWHCSCACRNLTILMLLLNKWHVCISFQVPKILYSFANTFRRVPKSEKSVDNLATNAELDFTFSVTLDFREDDGKGNYSACSKDKDAFKFRVNTEKRLIISVQQSGPHEIRIERYQYNLRDS